MICQTCKQEIKTNRSQQQNKYWWVCMTVIGDELGYLPEEVSILIKDKFHWYEEVVNKKTGEVLKDYQSSAKWDKELFSARTETLIQFASELGILIQTPEEFYNQ